MMTQVKRASLPIVGLALLSLLVWASLAPLSAAEPLRAVKIGLPPFYSSALAYVANDRGFWKEEGLEVSLLSFAGGSLVNEALLAGSIDLGMGTGVGPAIFLSVRDAPIVVVAGEGYADDESAPPEVLVVKKDSPITSIKQLDGKKVAIHAKGTLSHILVEGLHRRFGIKTVMLEIPAANQWLALSRGEVDAVMAGTPIPEQMKAQGGRYLYGLPSRDVVPYLAETATLTRREFAEKNPEVVKRVVKVVARTARWIMDNPEKTRTIITSRLKYTPDVVALIDLKSYKWSRNAAHLMPSIRWWGKQMEELKIVARQPEYERFFVSTHVEAALNDLGRVADPDYDRAVATPLK